VKNLIDPTLQPGAVSPTERLDILDRLLGFFDIKVLVAVIAHKLPEVLAEGPLTTEAIARRASLPERSVRFLLIGLSGMRFVERDDRGGYTLSALGQRYLLEKSPYYQGWYVRYWDWVANAATRLDEGITKNAPIWEGFGHYLKEDNEASREKEQIFNEAMTASQLFVAHTVLGKIDLRDAKRLLDVGGSFGRFAASAVSRFEGLRATVLDLPPVAARAREQVASWGVGDRVEAVGCDFLTDPWPPGHDVVSFIRILNSRTSDVIEHCFRKTFEYLPSGGRIVVADAPILPPPSGDLPQRQAARLSMLYFMASSGDVRTTDDWSRLLRAVGFSAPETIAFDDPYGMLVARKP
jgi:demethylspheroidene O-methyltransferase